MNTLDVEHKKTGGKELLGVLLIIAGMMFLIVGARMNLWPWGQDWVERLLVVLNAVCGASLATVGVGRISTSSSGKLRVFWAVSFMFVYATWLFGLVFSVILAVGVMITSLRQNPWLVLLTAVIFAGILLLVLLRKRERTKQGNTTKSTDEKPITAKKNRYLGMLGYVGLAMLGCAAWFLVPPYAASLLFRMEGEQVFALGLYALTTSPVGLVLGILTAIWANAASDGRKKARRYGTSVFLLILFPNIFVILRLLG